LTKSGAKYLKNGHFYAIVGYFSGFEAQGVLYGGKETRSGGQERGPNRGSFRQD
jgi:hypothetical protein